MVLSGGFPFLCPAEQNLSVFDFDTTEAARLVWTPSSDSLQVGLFEGIPGKEKKGLLFPCHFTSDNTRCYWDRNVSFDLSGERAISLRIYIENPSLLSFFTLYFHSPGGWYAGSTSNLIKGWQTLNWSKTDFGLESTPLGWHQIDKIRFSPWKAGEGDTNLIATELRAFTPPIFIVKPTKNPDEYYSQYTTDLISSCLDEYAIDYSIITDEDVENGNLKNAKLAFLPYNSDLTNPELTALEDFVTSGGKIVSFYILDSRIAGVLGMKVTGWIKSSLSGMIFTPGIVECAPEFVKQASWNITLAEPASPDAKVWARWVDEQGNLLDYPAWLLSDKGAFMTHILLNDDWENKRNLILTLVTHFIPDVRENIAQFSFENIGKIAAYDSFEEAVQDIRDKGGKTPRKTMVNDHLSSTTFFHTRALEVFSSETLCQTMDLSARARDHLLQAYYYSQKPLIPEFRAVWNHSGTGAFLGDWAKSAQNLAQNGFNAVFPNMLWAGLAHYDSDLLPHSDVFQTYGDQIEQCVSSCHEKGIEVHVWKVNWNLLNAPQDFIDQMRSQNRTQVDVNGEPVDWLCPSHPDNYQLELDTMIEVAENYDVDGVHFDYIRYPNENSCYCSLCKIRFEEDAGTTVTIWPQDCYSGSLKDSYRQWRADQITRLVRGVCGALKAQKPHVKISAAVFSQYPSCKTSVGQDWPFWVQEGYLDFICPMDYTDSVYAFRGYLESQMSLVQGSIPMYPGVYAASQNNTPDRILVQLGMTREYNTGGFIIFNYDTEVAGQVLPILRKGFTAPLNFPCIFILR